MGKNYVCLEGNLGQNPEMRKTTTTGAEVCSVSLATQYKKDGKEWVTWHRITTWNETAYELAACHKGDNIRVEGFIRYNEWEGKDGVKHKTAEIQCYSIELLHKRSDGKQKVDPTDEGDTPY